MSVCVANALLDAGYSVLHTDIAHIVNVMESSFEGRAGNLERILSYDLLCIEDLGAQRSTEYMMEHVFNVIDGRYKAGRPMVITTTSLWTRSPTQPRQAHGAAPSTASSSAAIR